MSRFFKKLDDGQSPQKILCPLTSVVLRFLFCFVDLWR